MESKSDINTPIAASSATTDVKTQSILEALEAPHKSPFLWKNCENEDQRNRVDIKQQAVCDGLKFGENIANALRHWHNENNHGIEIQEVMNWVEHFDTIKKSYQSYRGPTVAFLGVLGAGKTSLINALLGQEELLTSSSYRAATAVVCDVVYNPDFSGYRAEVTYRTRQSLTEQLDSMFDNLKWKSELELRKKALEESQDDGVPNDPEMEQINEQLADIDASMSDTLEAVSIIWGVSEDDLKDMSTQSLLNAEFYGAEYLGITKEVSETDQAAFADEISQYLESNSEDKTGTGPPPWPLIEKVTIYIKSDVLKYGLCFRDLPGLCDASEGRSNIARKNSKDIDITVIVAPAIRASDEQTAVSLIEQQQLIEMKMDGKSFCVVLSKTDDIKSEPYLRKAAKADKSIMDQISRVRELDTAFASTRPRKRKLQDQIPEHPSFVSGDNMEQNRRKANAIKEWLEHTAVSMRNRDITERIQRKFQERRREIGMIQNAELHSEAVEVFGVSEKAYWMSKHPDGEKARGFPDEKHSGIPRFRQWLFEAAFNRRERHLQQTLNKLSTLFLEIQNLIGWQSKNAREAIEPDSQAVHKIHKCHLLELTNLLKRCGEDLWRIDPLKEKETALNQCQKQCVGIVERWAYKYPRNKKQNQTLVPNVQAAILRRKGEKYQSRRYIYPQAYYWLDDLIEPFFKVILPNWEQAFQEAVPAYEKKIMDLTEPEWKRYEIALALVLIQRPAGSLEDIPQVRVAIESGKSDLKDRVRTVLDDLRTRSSDVYPVFRQNIKEALIPVFEKALDIKGTGAKSKRDKVLRSFAKDHSASMFQKALDELDAELSKLLRQHIMDLEGIAVESVSLVEKEVRSHFGARKAAASTVARNTTLHLQKGNQHSLEAWRACWETPPNPREDHVMRGDMSIPEPDPIRVEDGA